MYLLDTNVLSEMRAMALGRGDAAVIAWMRATDPDLFRLSAISLFEIERGVLLMERRDARQGRVLRDWMNTSVLVAFDGRVIEVSPDIARLAASFHVPDPAPLADSLIAATAVIHGLTVVTRNGADFRFPGVAVFNPWH